MTAPGYPVILPALLVPTDRELAAARARIATAGGAFSSSYTALGLAATGLAGAITRALLAGDVEAAAVAIRRLGALDLAAAELRARLVAEDLAEPAARGRRMLASVR